MGPRALKKGTPAAAAPPPPPNSAEILGPLGPHGLTLGPRLARRRTLAALPQGRHGVRWGPIWPHRSHWGPFLYDFKDF